MRDKGPRGEQDQTGVQSIDGRTHINFTMAAESKADMIDVLGSNDRSVERVVKGADRSEPRSPASCCLFPSLDVWERSATNGKETAAG
jgi:hypothetical protein